MKFYYVGESKKIVFGEYLEGVEGLVEVKANSIEAALEKHVPVYEFGCNNEECCDNCYQCITVKVGEVTHPMLDNHFIEFIVVETSINTYVKFLKPGELPEASFIIKDDEEVLNIYEYCNLHGLWVKKVK